jgi:hypothetical protein
MSLARKDFRPCLGETLAAFGFEPRNAKCLSSQHDSATDTVRAAALIIRFLRDDGQADISSRRPANTSNRGRTHRSIHKLAAA